MADVNVENTDLATTYVSGKHSRCCCGVSHTNSHCDFCRPTTQICCVKMTRSTLGHPIMLKRRMHMGDPTRDHITGADDYWELLWEDGLPCDEKGQTNLCGFLWSNLNCYNDEFSLKWYVSEDCDTVTVELYWVTFAGGRTPHLICSWSGQARDWHTGTLTGTDLETGGTVTLENCEAGVELWTDTETEPVFIQATLRFNGVRIECMFGYGNSVCGTTWHECALIYPTSTVEWLHSVQYGRVRFKAAAATALSGGVPSAAGRLTIDIDDSPDEWYLNLPLTITTSVTGYSWVVSRVYNCEGCNNGGNPPDDICDPGCWPLCVLCPDPLSMALVVTQDPSCCLHGSYGLTYNSGSNWFTLSSAVGGPDGVCGIIQSFKMTCSDSTHVTLSITYKDVNGNVNTTTATVGASCSGGAFETDSIDIDGGAFFPGLCEGGIGKGANIRVVSI
jgi:hypothetical protein